MILFATVARKCNAPQLTGPLRGQAKTVKQLNKNVTNMADGWMSPKYFWFPAQGVLFFS
jgi:hypothetical protein